ncbi:dynein assembly factor 5 axonemal [Biomphalaria pfeifferi]|uniref:Dynein assembly factor 5 axonemal n=1 Tax=Biomphalaria pfeifferi TaxID=112525 RepID=A0AAD8BM34_BIOPF|nr:dynein assembly factor 5 axonemal [Biomphalaria pfeifferi]
MASTDENSNAVVQGLSRYLNCLGDENRNTRRNALMNIHKDTVNRNPPLDSTESQIIFKEVVKPLLQTFSDPVEKCRELSISITYSFLKRLTNPDEYLSYLLPLLVQRLGQQEITESSEELRAQLIDMLIFLVESSKEKMGIYVDDCVKILQRTLLDPFPEVKRESCKCASLLSVLVPRHFYMQSDSLVKPLLQSISHQHSKVRMTVVETIGKVVMCSNGKVVEDVIPHLAQRLFDQTPGVRKAVTRIVGDWLLDLPDRYSYHHKLIPLLLTSLSDEQSEIRELADSLWHDVGLKYERENEEDLKDKIDFQALPPSHYPPNVERPNLGCRVLVNRHLSKILPGLVRDLGDWVVDTRVKSASLLYWLLINAEDYVTQHIDPLLNGLYKASLDEDQRVVTDIQRSAELVGYFVHPDIWKKMVLTGLRLSSSYGVVMTIAAIVRGSPHDLLHPHQGDIINALLSPDVYQTVDTKLHAQFVYFCRSLVSVMGSDVEAVSQQVFHLLVSVIAMSQSSDIVQAAQSCLDDLARVQKLNCKSQLFEKHTKCLIDFFGDSINMWTNHSVERQIFDALLIEAGPVVGQHLDDIIPVIVTNLQPEKDPELRLKFFSLLSRLVMSASTTLDSDHRFSNFATTVVKDMILPNCIWKAGKTAGAIRTTSISCFWALLQSGVLTKEKMKPVVEATLTQLLTLIEDDNKTTRLVSCRVLTRLFDLMGTVLGQDRLHNMYPELLKRLDDSNDEIRLTVTKTLLAYFDCFEGGYDVRLYRAHLEAIYKGLLVHLDDPESKIQEAVLVVMKKAAELFPQMLIKEVESVKHKHRSTKFCDDLIEYAQSLASKSNT